MTDPALSRCCGAPCWAAGLDEYGPCCGAVDVIDEDDADDPDLATWVHGCQAHQARGEMGRPPPPTAPSA